MTTDQLLTTIVGICVDAQQHLEDGCDSPEELVASLTGDILELVEAHDRQQSAPVQPPGPINFPRGMW